MENMGSVIESFTKDPIISTELMAHCGGGYSKHLYVETNVITKDVYKTLESAIDGYEKIKRV